MGISATDISQRIVEAVLAQRLAPGARLGEQQLAMLFDCSRTIVREALTRLAARGIVTVSARRGWYLIAPTPDDVREAWSAPGIGGRLTAAEDTPYGLREFAHHDPDNNLLRVGSPLAKPT